MSERSERLVDGELRSLRDGDETAIAAIFAGTQLLGRPLPFRLDGEAWFTALAIGWYLDHGREDSVVAVDTDGEVAGYGLVCTDPDGHRRWLRRHAVATVLRLMAMTVSGGIGAPSRAFYRRRLRDAVHLARHGQATAGLGHAHVNVPVAHRSGRVARAIRDHVDDRCRAAGLVGWFGEVNARPGQRRGALARVAGDIVDSATNHTLSYLTGEPVQRLTVIRTVSALVGEERPVGEAPRGADRSSWQA